MTLENKRELKRAVFGVLKFVYDIPGSAPKSEKQEKFINDMVDYVYENFDAKTVGALPIPHEELLKDKESIFELPVKLSVNEEGNEVKRGRGRPKGAKNGIRRK